MGWAAAVAADASRINAAQEITVFTTDALALSVEGYHASDGHVWLRGVENREGSLRGP
jgi:hypothetical protein